MVGQIGLDLVSSFSLIQKDRQGRKLIIDWLNYIETAADYTPCAPRWLYFTFAIGLFIYQSLDAIDGKQARRTGKYFCSCRRMKDAKN